MSNTTIARRPAGSRRRPTNLHRDADAVGEVDFLFLALDHLDAVVEMLKGIQRLSKAHRIKVEQAVIRASGVIALDELLEKGGADPQALGREAGLLAGLEAHAMSELQRLTETLEAVAMPGLNGLAAAHHGRDVERRA